jgi:type IV pilus assembly protein PilE
MLTQPTTRPSRLRGFTLVELMIVIVIGAILLSLAVPAYTSSIRKTRRADAKTGLLELAGREERFLTTNPAGYTTTPTDLGMPGIGPGNPIGTGGYYYVPAVGGICITPANSASVCPPSTLPGPSFLITALPMAGTSQTGDTQCTGFMVDSGGGQFVVAGSTLAAPQCWQN